MIRLEHVTQHYGVRPVLRDISLQIEAGDLVTIIGPNGMGKTTLLSVMAGVLQPQKGHVEIAGIRRRSGVEEELAIRRRTVYLPDHPWLPLELTGREFLLGVGPIYDVEEDRLLDHAARLLDLFDLAEVGDWPIRSYSNGQQKKVAICSALVTDAPLLLLDEPFSGGLDPSGILALKRILQTLSRRTDVTIVMTTPVPEIVESFYGRILVLRDGEICGFDTLEGLQRLTQSSGPLSEVLERMIHPDTLSKIDRYIEEIER
jgi:ABC-2 type transport system ATP-binding protein